MRRIARTLVALTALFSLLVLSACAGGGTGSKVTINDEGVLSEPVTVKVSASSKNLALLPVFMANRWDEFKKRNITIEPVITDASSGYVLLATGKADAIWSAPSVGLFNAVADGADIRLVASGSRLPADTGAGIYVSTQSLGGKTFEPAMLRGAKIASAQGNTGTTMIALAALLREGGLDISDVEIVTMPTTDQVAALENGSVTAGIIVEPLNLPLVERNAAVRVWPTTMDDYPISTLAFGPTLLRDNPDVGKAFIAALRDTYINHLQGDYLHDPAKAKSIAEEIEQPLPSLQQVRSDIYGPTLTLPADLIARHEETWRQWPKLLTYEEPLVQSDVVDMRFVDWANAKDD